MNLDTAQKVHVIGIGGIGISAIARLLLLQGKEVQGSDVSRSPITDDLGDAGATIAIGHETSLITDDLDLVIYTKAIDDTNPELKRAKELGLASLSYPEALGELSKNKFTIAVSGTHGKTTTTAMIAKIMMEAGMDPTVIVGSIMTDAKSNLLVGKSEYLVVEACEYKRSFLNLHPTILVITNIDNDHLDYFQDLNDIVSAFRSLAEQVRENGFIVTTMNDPHIREALRDAKAEHTDYTRFDLDQTQLKTIGEFNEENARAAATVGHLLGIRQSVIRRALEGFSGTWRRQEFKGEMKCGAKIYDDYAHHPRELRSMLTAFKKHFPDKKITLVFQPHLYSRTKLLFDDFAGVLKDADSAIIGPIYAAREAPDASVSPRMLSDAVNQAGGDSLARDTFAEIVTELKRRATESDVIITVGAGDIYKVGEQLLS